MGNDTNARLEALELRIESIWNALNGRVERLEVADRRVLTMEQLASQLEDDEAKPVEAAPVDTSWHPYKVSDQGDASNHPTGDERVVVMLRNGAITYPYLADTWDWDECSSETIVAWRYAKEGEK